MSNVIVKETGIVDLIFPTKENIKEMLKAIMESDNDPKESILLSILAPCMFKNIGVSNVKIPKYLKQISEAIKISRVSGIDPDNFTNLLAGCSDFIWDACVNAITPLGDPERSPYIWLDDISLFVTYARGIHLPLDASTGILKVVTESEMVAFDGTDQSLNAILDGVIETIDELINAK